MTDGDNPFLERGRDEIELLEESELAPGAARAAASKGRDRFEEHDPRRTAFDRDRDRILHSKAFRRLKHKTQVFINPEDDHYVTRLTHTLQVTQIGRSLARYLSLNETLTEAICLGHDVGHSPFGHTGEEALSEYLGRDWIHSEQSVRIFNVLEPLNLTWEVLDGVRSHPWRIDPPPTTYEGRLCRYSDRIAYLAHDVQDALRAGVLTRDDMPPGRDRDLWRAREGLDLVDDGFGGRRVTADRRHRDGARPTRRDAPAARLHVRAGSTYAPTWSHNGAEPKTSSMGWWSTSLLIPKTSQTPTDMTRQTR